MIGKEKSSLNYGIISNARGVIFGITTLWIALYHSTGLSFSKTRLSPFFSTILDGIRESGNIGVDVFLVMSGVGLYYSMSDNSNVRLFYKKRFLRLFPSVFICSIIWFGIMDNGFFFFVSHSIMMGVFITGETYFWYISLLIILYLFYPLIYRVGKENEGFGRIIGVVIISWIIGTYFFQSNDYYRKIEIVINRVPAFLIGCYLGKLAYQKKHMGAIIIISAIVILVPFIIIFLNEKTMMLYRYIGTIIGVCMVIIISIIHHYVNAPIIEGIFEGIGKYSLEFYMLYTAVYIFCKGVFRVKSASGIGYCIPVFTLTFILCILLKQISTTIQTVLGLVNSPKYDT